MKQEESGKQTRSPLTPSHPFPFSTTYAGHGPLVALAWSPDGSCIAAAGIDHPPTVWNGVTGEVLTVYREQMGDVFALSWSPDGLFVVSVGEDESIHVWNARTGTTHLNHQGHLSGARAVSWSPDGTRIASGGDDNTVQVWNAMHGELLNTYRKVD